MAWFRWWGREGGAGERVGAQTGAARGSFQPQQRCRGHRGDSETAYSSPHLTISSTGGLQRVAATAVQEGIPSSHQSCSFCSAAARRNNCGVFSYFKLFKYEFVSDIDVMGQNCARIGHCVAATEKFATKNFVPAREVRRRGHEVWSLEFDNCLSNELKNVSLHSAARGDEQFEHDKSNLPFTFLVVFVVSFSAKKHS